AAFATTTPAGAATTRCVGNANELAVALALWSASSDDVYTIEIANGTHALAADVDLTAQNDTELRLLGGWQSAIVKGTRGGSNRSVVAENTVIDGAGGFRFSAVAQSGAHVDVEGLTFRNFDREVYFAGGGIDVHDVISRNNKHGFEVVANAYATVA